MNIIKDFERKKELERNPRIKLKEIVNWNTSWAKDKEGNEDNVNLIHCLVFDYNGKELVFFPTEIDSENCYKNYKKIAQYNRENDNTGKEHHNDLDNWY